MRWLKSSNVLFHLSIIKISVFLTVFFVLLSWVVEFHPSLFPFLSSMSLKAMVDNKFSLRKKETISDDILLVTMDEKSFEAFGRWPWRRTILAKSLLTIAKGNPKAIAMDLTFSEPDPYNQAYIFRDLQKSFKTEPAKNQLEQKINTLVSQTDTDHMFATTLEDINKKIPNILGYFFFFTPSTEMALDGEKDPDVPSSLLQMHTPRVIPRLIPKAIGVKMSLGMYQEAIPYHGYFDLSSDVDGSIRKAQLVMNYQESLKPSLSLLTASLVQNKKISVMFNELGIEKLGLGEHGIPTNLSGAMWINYKGPSLTFPQVSFSDIYHEKISTDVFKDKIILMGLTAKAAVETFVSPVDNAHLGLEINANILENLIHENFISRPQYFFIAEVLFILLMGIILAILYGRLHAGISAVMTICLLGAYFSVDYFFIFSHHYLANSFIPSLHLVMMFIGNTAYRYFTEEKKSREVRDAFQHYVSPTVVSEILKAPDKLVLGGEKREVSVLFADIRGFTDLSEVLSPEKLTEMLNIYMTDMTETIFEQHGMLDKYIGDEIMAIFGAPVPMPTHAKDACRAAISMVKRLPEIRQKLAHIEQAKQLDMGVGINLGEVILGNMGSKTIFNYTVIGENVNVASRVQRLNREYGTHIIVGETVYETVKSEFTWREIDLVRVKGKQQPTRIYELLSDHASQELLDRFSEGLSFYRKNQWDKAHHIFTELNKKFPQDGPSQLFLKRCQEFKSHAPEADWQGVYTFKQK